MESRNIPYQVFSFVIYILVQVLLVRNLVLFDTAFCFVYVAFILLLPIEAGPLLLMFLGLFTGLAIDIFYDSLGIHAAACVLTAYLRTHWIGLLTPRGGYDQGMAISVRSMGLEWFATYSFFLVFLHHLALFFLEAGGTQWFFFTLGKVFFSSLFTFILIVIFQYLFYGSRKVV
jgi:hypothetical protein